MLFGAGGSRFVDAYAFDLSPPTDDRPLFDRLSRQADWGADPLFRGLLGGAGLGWLLALVALALLGMRLRPHGALRSALAFGSVGAAQVLLYAWLAHVLALLIPRPEIGLALAALAWPLLALAAAPLPVGGTPTFAFAAQALAAAASVVLPVLVVLAYGYRALLLSAVLLLLVAAAATWVGRSRA